MSQNIHKDRVHTSFLKSLYSYNQHATVQTEMAEELVYALRTLKKMRCETVLEIGCGTGMFTERLLKSFQIEHLYVNDLVPEYAPVIAEIVKQHSQGSLTFLGGDIETLPNLPESLDLIVSNATFQWLEDMRGFVLKMKNLLNPGGVLAFSTFGPENLREIRMLTGNSLDYLPHEEIQRFLEKHFQIIACSEQIRPLNFSSPHEVLKHLSLTGVNGLSGQQWTKSALRRFEQTYRDSFGTNHSVPLTYHPILCIVRT